MNDVLNGIIVGGAGGAIAGLALSLVNGIRSCTLQETHKRRVYNWLLENTSNEPGNQYRSTSAVSSNIVS
jgi:hypothetical protein